MPLVSPSGSSSSSVDGSIRINTKIDEGGFNRGVANMNRSATASISKLKSSLATMGAIAIDATAKAANSGKQLLANLGVFLKRIVMGGLLILGASIAVMFRSLRESLQTILDVNLKGSQISKDVEYVKNQFTELKSAVAIAFLPLLTAAIPYIKSAMSWMIQLFNKVAMFIGALFGQTQVLQVVEGSAAVLANEAKAAEEAKKKAKADEKSAKAAERTTKAKRGELAAFDQINVLQRESDISAGGIADIPAVDVADTETALAQVATKMVPITDSILSKVAEIKAKWAEFVAWLQGVGDTVQRVWTKMKELVVTGMSFILSFGATVISFILSFGATVISAVLSFGATILSGILSIGATVISKILSFGAQALSSILSFGATVLSFFLSVWENVKAIAVIAWAGITAIWSGAGAWFTVNVVDKIRAGFASLLAWLPNAWNSAFSSLSNFSRGIINNIIGFINGMVRGIASAINSVADVIGRFKINLPPIPIMGFPGLQWSGGSLPRVAAIQIPYLASGAVVPAHANMLAMIGEGSQKEIVTPENMMRQVFEEVLSRALTNQNFTMSFEGTLGALVRELKPHIDRENTRVGGSLIKRVSG